MKTNLVDIGLKDAEGNPAPVWDGVSSAEAPSKPAGPVGSLGVVGGSNPGLSAEGLAYLWEQEAHALRSAADRNCRTMRTAHAILYGKAEQLEKCAEELRRQRALPTSRQPESNNQVTDAQRSVE